MIAFRHERAMARTTAAAQCTRAVVNGIGVTNLFISSGHHYYQNKGRPYLKDLSEETATFAEILVEHYRVCVINDLLRHWDEAGEVNYC
jgi:hypothetical protein